MSTAEQINRILERQVPSLFAALSPLGRRAFYPPDIPFQAQQARGKAYNATIGQITDGAGHILALETIGRALSGLDDEDRNRALLYSPMEGLPELRESWRRWHAPDRPDRRLPDSSLPIVTCGLTHGLALCADLFGGPGRKVFVPAPFWGNYRQTFGVRTGADVVPVTSFVDRLWQPTAIAEAMAGEPAGQPVVTILNIPSNPTGYSPTVAERGELVASLLAVAEKRPVIAICDDAYAGLVFDEQIPKQSLYWDLVGLSDALVPIKIDGSTKEFVFFGGRVGFVTFPYAPDSAAVEALENKVKGLIRSGIGSPPALSQITLLQALRSGGIRAEIDGVVETMALRWRLLRAELERAEREHGLFQVMPFNSGAFAVLKLSDGVDPDAVRRHLLDHEDVGLVAIQPCYLRIAFCSLAADSVAELVSRTVRGIGTIVGAEALISDQPKPT